MDFDTVITLIDHQQLFDYLIGEKEEQNGDPYPYCHLGGLHNGSSVLNLVVACKRLFVLFGPFINNELIFRNKSDKRFQFYAPKHIHVLGRIDVSLLPTSVSQITIQQSHSYLPALPSSITHLHINQHCCLFFIPPALTYFKYQSIQFRPSPQTFSSTLTRLDIYYLPFPLPPLLTHLTFKRETMSPFLPPLSLKYLKCSLTQRIQLYLKLLPPLIELNLSSGMVKDEDIEKLQFSTSLISLRLELDNTVLPIFPSSLQSLTIEKISAEFPTIIANVPPFLTYLSCNSFTVSSPLPSTLKYLKIDQLTSAYHLPFLTDLYVHYYSFASFPPNLTTLEFFELEVIPSFPSSLTHLTINNSRFSLISLPPLLQKFKLEDRHQLPSLPSSLVSLEFTSIYSPSVPSLFPLPVLPDSLTSLILNHSCNTFFTSLPPNIRNLVFPWTSTYNLILPFLPSSLLWLYLPRDYDCPLLNTPQSLLLLKCSEKWNSKYQPNIPLWCELISK